MFIGLRHGCPRALALALLIVAALLPPNQSLPSLLPALPSAMAQTVPMPDPTLLPGATTAQVPLTAAYNALNVPALAAGSTYLDPTTSIKIYKVTSPTFPIASTGYYWTHSYSEGGDEVSLPHTGTTRTIHLLTGNGWHWLVDFAPGVGLSNPRVLDGTLKPWDDLAFAFSNNPATPYYAYTTDGTTIRRFDIRSMAEVPGGGFPVTDTAISWLHQAKNDSFFVWRQQNLGVVVGYEPATGIKKTTTNTAYLQPRVDREGRYVGITMANNAATFWDWSTNTIVWTSPGDPGIPFAHIASLRRRWIGEDWNMTYPPDFTAFDPTAGPAVHFPGPGVGSTFYGNGNWIQPNAALDQQWAAVYNYGSLQPAGTGWLSPGGVVLITQAGQRRLAFHPYNTSATYSFYSFAKFSPDGAYMLFTSDMNGSGRSDVFLAELPTTTNNPAPSISTLSPNSVLVGSAAFTLTVAGTNLASSSVVQWNGSSRTTTYVSGTQLQAAISASDVAMAGTAQVTVFTPAPGGGTSSALPFTVTPKYALSVSRTGTGSGTVTSAPAGINCGASCSASFASGTAVGLAATAAANSTFGGWTGCDSVNGAQCTVVVTAARTVTATFQAIPGTPPTVSITAPTAGATVSGTTTVSASATSSVGIAWVQFQLDGANLGGQVATTPYTIAWNTLTVSNGAHSLTALAQDTAGLQATSQAVGVTVGNPPGISAGTASAISSSGAGITWTTSTPSDSQVEYGLTTSYGTATPLNTSLVTAHAVTLSGLTASTTYHYRVKSGDAQGNLAVSGDYAFTTAPASAGPAQVVWTNPVNVTVTGNSLQKTSGCDGCFDAGAFSQQQIHSGDGYAEFTATETTLLRVAGLTHSFNVTTWHTIDFGIRLQSGTAEVRENGLWRADTPFVAGDVFRITVTSGVVRYSKNGVVFYTSTVTPTYPLFFAAALANLNSTVTNAIMVGAF